MNNLGLGQSRTLQVLVILGQGGLLGLLDVLLDLLLPLGVHGDLWGHKGGHGDKLEVGVTNKLPNNNNVLTNACEDVNL